MAEFSCGQGLPLHALHGGLYQARGLHQPQQLLYKLIEVAFTGLLVQPN